MGSCRPEPQCEPEEGSWHADPPHTSLRTQTKKADEVDRQEEEERSVSIITNLFQVGRCVWIGCGPQRQAFSEEF